MWNGLEAAHEMPRLARSESSVARAAPARIAVFEPVTSSFVALLWSPLAPARQANERGLGFVRRSILQNKRVTEHLLVSQGVQ